MDGIVEIIDPQDGGGVIGDDPGDEGGKEDFIEKRPDEEDLQSEDGAGYRRPEDGGKTGADAADHEFFPVIGIQAKGIGKGGGQPAADLGAGSHLSGGTTGGDGHYRGAELRGNDHGPHGPAVFVDRLDHLFRAVALGFPGHVLDDQDTGEESQGQGKVITREILGEGYGGR